ncbi:MAG: pilus assembly protein PilM [Planctomycetaceae bacterium]
MATATRVDTDFDPYLAWLNIRVKHRPLNPYELLGMKVLDGDLARIRTAAGRMKTLLELKQPKAPPELWQKIWDEVVQAELMLLDSEQRQVIDAGLKRKMAISPPASVLQQEDVAGGSGLGLNCKECGTENPASRRFCGSCGTSLWVKCPTCATEIPGNERFCGQCGTDVIGFIGNKRQELAEKFARAQDLVNQSEFSQAISVLRSVASIDDARFSDWAEQAVLAIANTEEDWKRAKQDTEVTVRQAKKLLEMHSYDKAMNLLKEVPEPLLTVEGHQLLEDATQKRAELVELSSDIRQSLAEEKIWDFFPKIERLMVLKPNHPQVPTLIEEVRKRLVRKAKKRLAERNFAEAMEIIEHIPEFADTDEVKELRETIIEMATLKNHVSLSPWVDETTLRLAKRLVDIDSGNEEFKELQAKLQAAGKQVPREPRQGLPTWVTTNRKMPLGKSVDWLAKLATAKVAESVADATAIRETLSAHLGEFWMALGLALQGAGQAAVEINLLPPEKESVWGRLKSSFARKEAISAWGIDLGEFSIKAIRLSTDAKGENPQVTGCVYLPHSVPMSQASDESERNRVLLEGLKTLKEKIGTGKDRICAAMPSMQVLGRFFELPPMPSKKVAEAVKFELQHQIPIHANDLSWGYVATDSSVGVKKDDTVSRRVVLVATRVAQMTARSSLFEAAGLPLDILQSGCVALHNAMTWELAGESMAQAMIDVGASGVSVVVSSAAGIWFRSFGLGAENTISHVAKELRLTTDQARKLIRQPYMAKRISPLEDVLLPLHAQVVGDVERSLTTASKSLGGIAIGRIWGLGGGILAHAMMRQLIHGK